MLHLDANPITINIWLQSYKEFVNAQNNIKHRILNIILANISKTISDIRLIPRDHVTYIHNYDCILSSSAYRYIQIGFM